MRKFLIILLALMLCAGVAAAEEAGVLGMPFPDFTATDTEGNVFTLSEALKDHEAALINIWATWCPPCRAEMPYLNEAYAQYGDRVAFIALSCEANDTLEKIEAYRRELGLSFPMGRDEGSLLYQHVKSSGIPVTVIVDRFGNAGFMRIGSFLGTGEIARVIEAFLGDGYTETTVLNEIPKDATTRAFPVAAARAIHVENEDARRVLIRATVGQEPLTVYVVADDVAHLRLEPSANDNLSELLYYNLSDARLLQELYDADRNAFVFDQPMPNGATEDYYAYACLFSGDGNDPDMIGVYLIPDEEHIETILNDLRSQGFEVSWEYSDEEAPGQAAEAYVLHIVDQDGAPVPGVTVNFCTDATCTPAQSGDDGLIRFDGAPDSYHVQLLQAPEGYSFDPDFELYTAAEYGEWLLRVRRD